MIFDRIFFRAFFNRNTKNTDRSLWPTKELGDYINAGAYPLDLLLFKKHLNELRSIFTIKKRFVDEAKAR